jgi:hypothetical protein
MEPTTVCGCQTPTNVEMTNIPFLTCSDGSICARLEQHCRKVAQPFVARQWSHALTANSQIQLSERFASREHVAVSPHEISDQNHLILLFCCLVLEFLPNLRLEFLCFRFVSDSTQSLAIYALLSHIERINCRPLWMPSCTQPSGFHRH